MTLDAKTIESAVEIFTAKLGPCFHSVGSIDAKLISAFKETLDAADLVERKTLDANTLGHMVDEKLFHLEAERDEARREAEELRSDLAYSKNEFELRADLAETQGRQLAALRKALEQLRQHTDGPISGSVAKLVCDALTDTAEAAAQWVRVDKAWADALKAAALAVRGSYVSHSIHADNIEAAILGLRPPAAPQAGEPEGK